MTEQDYESVRNITALRVVASILSSSWYWYENDDLRVHKAHKLIIRAINDLEKKIEKEE